MEVGTPYYSPRALRLIRAAIDWGSRVFMRKRGPGPAIVVATLIGPLPYPDSIRNMPTPLSPNSRKGPLHAPARAYIILRRAGAVGWDYSSGGTIL